MIRGYLLQCYRLDAGNNAVATVERKGKYSGAATELDGRQVPHGVGTFKTSTGYIWTGTYRTCGTAFTAVVSACRLGHIASVQRGKNVAG